MDTATSRFDREHPTQWIPASAGMTIVAKQRPPIVVPAQAGTHKRNACSSIANASGNGFPPSRE